MNAILMVLALGAAPAAVERDDPELAAEEAKAIRKELISVRAELRRVAAREEAEKVRRGMGGAEAEAQERLAKDPIYLKFHDAIQVVEAKILDVRRTVKEDAADRMVRSY